MAYSTELAEKRFGCGLSPDISGPARAGDILAGLHAADEMAERFPIETFDTFRLRMIDLAAIRKKMRQTRGTEEFKTHLKMRNDLNKQARFDMQAWFLETLFRWFYTRTGFRERLAAFWGDHFTAHGKQGLVRRATSPYVEEAIRPHLAGRFEDLLTAAVTHPIMLMYLDQMNSVGPQSKAGLNSKGKRGLNENLAREVLELHTLGVDGRYTQDDVRQLAELFTGMTFRPAKGFLFVPQMAEPGAETLLGHSYGDDPATVAPVLQALRDLAAHPDTARHIARKLAVHFVADEPDPGLVAAMERRYRETGGDLGEVYGVLLDHPAAWDPVLHNVKPPFDFVASACRALAIRPEGLRGMNNTKQTALMTAPIDLMGQPWQKPPGPDGWPEEDSAWVTPQGVSARLRWAMTVPPILRLNLPDPRAFVYDALGAAPPEKVQFAAHAAERRIDAIGLILASPAFQRR